MVIERKEGKAHDAEGVDCPAALTRRYGARRTYHAPKIRGFNSGRSQISLRIPLSILVCLSGHFVGELILVITVLLFTTIADREFFREASGLAIIA